MIAFPTPKGKHFFARCAKFPPGAQPQECKGTKSGGKAEITLYKRPVLEYNDMRTGILLLQEGYAMSDLDLTRRFNISRTEEWETRQILSMVYAALQEKGYNPINQIVGYILSEDPTYITNYNNARTLIRKMDRDELLQELVRYYLDV